MVQAGRGDKRYRSSFDRQSVDLHAPDAASVARSIFHCDVISGGAMPEGELIAGPGGGNARFECEMIALQSQTKNPLESGAVEPAG